MSKLINLALLTGVGGIFESWQVSIISFIRQGAAFASVVILAILVVILLIAVFQAVTAYQSQGDMFRKKMVNISLILVGMVLVGTFGSWGMGWIG